MDALLEPWQELVVTSTRLCTGEVIPIEPVDPASEYLIDTAQADELTTALSRLETLMCNEDEDERPTDEARVLARGVILLLLGPANGISVPAPNVVTAIGRGVDLRWRKGENEVHVHFPQSASGQPYIYFEDQDHFDSVDGCSPNVILRYVNQFIFG